MTGVASVVLAAILSQPLATDVKGDHDRLKEIAEEIAQVSGEHRAPLGGPASAEAWALFYEAIAYHESGFLPWVERCEEGFPGANDGGTSFGLMQVHVGLDGLWSGRTRAEICGSRIEQLRAGGEKLRVSARACSASPMATLRCYTGKGRLGDKPAQEIMAIYSRSLARAGITLRSGLHGVTAEWTSPPVAAPEDPS